MKLFFRFLFSLVLLNLALATVQDSSADTPTSLLQEQYTPLRFAVPQTLLNDNWLTIPPDFTDRLVSWDDVSASAGTGSQTHPPQWDAVMLNGEESAIGCAQGWLVAFYTTQCSKPAGYLHSALIWDRDRFPAPPDWSAMWDMVRYPGKRGLPQQARGALEFALLANNIPPGNIYKTLSTAKGQKFAFSLLDRIRPFIAWYRTPDEFQKLLHDKGIVIGIAPLSALTSAPSLEINSSFVPDLSHSVYSKRFWSIPSSLSETQRVRVEKILEESPPHLTYMRHHLTKSSLIIDDDFWMIYARTLEPVFEKWLATGIVDFKALSH